MVVVLNLEDYIDERIKTVLTFRLKIRAYMISQFVYPLVIGIVGKEILDPAVFIGNLLVHLCPGIVFRIQLIETYLDSRGRRAGVDVKNVAGQLIRTVLCKRPLRCK